MLVFTTGVNAFIVSHWLNQWCKRGTGLFVWTGEFLDLHYINIT